MGSPFHFSGVRVGHEDLKDGRGRVWATAWTVGIQRRDPCPQRRGAKVKAREFQVRLAVGNLKTSLICLAPGQCRVRTWGLVPPPGVFATYTFSSAGLKSARKMSPSGTLRRPGEQLASALWCLEEAHMLKTPWRWGSQEVRVGQSVPRPCPL